MIKTIIAVLVLIFFAFLIAGNADAQTSTAKICETPLMTMAELDTYAQKNNFEYELNDFSGVEAQSAREYVMSMVPNPQDVIQFDRIIMAISDAEPDASYVALYKDDCMVAEFTDTKQHYYEIERYVKGT